MTQAQMRLAHVSIAGRGETDRFLATLAAAFEAEGVRLAGTVQTNLQRADRHKCDMDLRVLPDGPTLRISEDRGGLARGCMLDHGALEQAVVEVSRRLQGADLLIVNKFGKSEAEGRGLVPVITAALEQGIAVIVGVNGLNMADFQGFAADLSAPLPADLAAIQHWYRQGRVAA
jgi:nucleoside-triphosphatase THEP1